MEQFKLYLEQELQKLKEELQKVTTDIDTLPSEEELPIEEYGNIKALKKEYRLNSTTSLIKRITPVTKKELARYIRNNEYTKLLLKKNKLTRIIDEIQSAILSIKDNQIIKVLPSSNEVVKLLLSYVVTSDISSEDTLKMLISILRNTHQTDHITSKIRQNIISHFSTEGTLLNDDKYDTLKLLFDKFFMTLYTSKELEQNSPIITEIMTELKILHSKETDPESKEELLSQKEALQKLRTYIKDGKIIATSENLKEFGELLNTAKIDTGISHYYLSQMQERINKEKEIAEELKKEQAVKEFLSEEEQTYLAKAHIYESKTTGQMHALITRTKNDVISICRYLDMIKNTDEFQETIDILNKRIAILKELLSNLEKAGNNKSVFYYLADIEGMPYLLRTIESLDISSYKDIYKLLKTLANNRNSGKIKNNISGINIYELKGETYQLEYTRIYNEIIIINIQNSTFQGEKSSINQQMLIRLKELMEQTKTKEVKNIHAQYEKMILRSLNPEPQLEALTLSKKER